MARKIKTTIRQIQAKDNQRLLVISDIHGHPDHLFQLLGQMNYREDDILILVGDLIEKGPESLRAVQYVMDLARRHPVYVSMGNVELGRLWRIDDDSPEGLAAWTGFLTWVEKAWGSSLYLDMLADLGIPLKEAVGERAAECRQRIREQFHEELEFLRNLPTILTAGKYIFVHGGIPTEEVGALEGTDPQDYLKNDAFLDQGYAFRDHVVVVGHWPVCLYRKGEEDVSPVFDRERQILCIDGGCGLKRSGQLNGIIIPHCQAGIHEIGWLKYDGFAQVEALKKQEGRAASVHIQYFDPRVELLEQKDDMGLWRHVSTDREFWGPMKWRYYTDEAGGLCYSDYTDTLLNVEPGDRLSVILKTSRGYYCKKGSLTGWYQKEARPVKQELILKPGAPDRSENHRRERELAVYELLNKLGICYERIDHPQADTMEACRAVDEALKGAVICKNLFLCNQQRTRFYLLMMPGDKKFRTRELSGQIGSSRLSFGEAVHMERYLHISPGSVSVMGLMHDVEHNVQLLIDRDILQGEYFGCHPCVNTSSIRLRMRDLLEIFLPAVKHEPAYVELSW